MPVFYAAFSGHVFRGALRDILINCVRDRSKERTDNCTISEREKRNYPVKLGKTPECCKML